MSVQHVHESHFEKRQTKKTLVLVAEGYEIKYNLQLHISSLTGGGKVQVLVQGKLHFGSPYLNVASSGVLVQVSLIS